MESVQTEFGAIQVDELVRIYRKHRQSIARRQEMQNLFLQTPEGKQYNRERAKAYYDRHKEAILEKRKEAYQIRKQQQEANAEANAN